jgi:hypothetical protein
MFVVIVTNALYPIRLAFLFRIFYVFPLWKNRVGMPILMINSPREQKKNKVIVCSVSVNRKKKFNLSLKWLNDFWVWFLFLGEIWSFIIGGTLMWLGLLVSITKRTYNHSIWNLIFNIHFFVTKLVLLYFHPPFTYY